MVVIGQTVRGVAVAAAPGAAGKAEEGRPLADVEPFPLQGGKDLRDLAFGRRNGRRLGFRISVDSHFHHDSKYLITLPYPSELHFAMVIPMETGIQVPRIQFV